MNNSINYLDLDKINTQIERADIQKLKLIKIINKEYEIYLQLVRDLLLTSVQKGIQRFSADQLKNDVEVISLEFFEFLEKKVNNLINLKLPLITIEQLKIINLGTELNYEINLNSLTEITELKGYKKVNISFADEITSEKPQQFHINKNIFSSCDYYKSPKNKQFLSIDLDNKYNKNYFSGSQITKKIDFERKFTNSLLELIGEVNNNEFNNYENLDDIQSEIPFTNQNLNCFEIIDNSLTNLLLSLSYKINLELFESKLIKKIISEEAFKCLATKKFMVKHPYPYVISIDPNINQLLRDDLKSESLCLFNINTVELEFNNLNLSIHRNKINELKNQFKLLIKKENYWLQKKKN